MTPEEFKQGMNQASSMGPPDEKPWLPFHSKEDFEFAEIVHKAAMNQSQANALIKLIHHCQKNPGSFTLGNYDEVKNTWETASKLLTKVSIISVNYTKLSVLILWFQFDRHEIKLSYDGAERQYEAWSRPLWGWIMDHLMNKEVVSQFEWDSQKVQRYDGEGFTRVYTEPWTGDRFWEVQVYPTSSVLRYH